MPRKTGVVKTYGRHKFRTVKSQPWLSPEGDCRSPVESYDPFPFDNNTRTDHSLNIFKPKSSVWSKPSSTKSNVRKIEQKNGVKSFMFDSSPESDKENISVSLLSTEEANNSVSRRSSNSRKDNPFSNHGTSSFTQRHAKLTNGEPGYPSNVKSAVVLASDTPEDAAEDNHSFEEVLCCIEDSVYGKLSFETSSSSTSETPRSAGSTRRWDSSFKQEPPNVMPCRSELSITLTDLSRGKETGSNSSKDSQNGFCTHIAPGLKQQGYKDSILSSENDSNTHSDLALHSCSRLQQVTSTPIFGQTRFLSTGSKSDSQCSLLKGDEIMLEPLRITPMQYDCGMAKETGSEGNIEVSPEGSKSLSSHVLLFSHKELGETCTSSEEPENSQKNTRLISSVRLKECVVSLTKLRLTPLTCSKQIRKCPVRSSASNTPSHISVSRRSHLSFAEALTPLKRIIPTCNQDEEEERNLSAFEKVLLECGQDRPANLMEFLKASLLDKCVKIGEGVYGEVFRVQSENGKPVALKIIPAEGDFLVNGEPQKSFEEILSEIVISKELSSLGDTREEEVPLLVNMTPSFIRVHSVTCCQGKYPTRLIEEWDRWNKGKSSENDRPDIFPDDQYFIVFEFSNGGKDLESFDFSTQSEAWSVLQQTALGLAVAENALEFEHRDLHWGNILICRTDNDFVESRLLGEKKTVASHGVHVSLIDFTLSRLTKDGVTVFCNLDEDKSLFTGRGDYQFDIYRQMKKSNQNDWESFNPYTNVLWLHYLADKMLKKKTYASKDRQSEANLRRFLRQARKISSATEIVQELFD